MGTTPDSWPQALARYVAVNSERTWADLMDAIRRLGRAGEPAQAEALLALLAAYRGPGRAPDALHERAAKLVGERSDAALALQAFRLHDRIASAPEALDPADVAAGLEAARAMKHDGLQAYFALLQAQLLHGAEEIPAAKELALGALDALAALAARDPAYREPQWKAAVNATSFCVLDGDFARARRAAETARALGAGDMLAPLAAALEPTGPSPADLAGAIEAASDRLESGDVLGALVGFKHAEALAVRTGDERALCGLLGDLAVAFRRAGNARAAIETNRRAVELSRKHGDDLDVARWSGNLGGILLRRGDLAGAKAAFDEAAVAATRTGRADQVSAAAGNLAGLLAQTGRHADALETCERALAQADAKLARIWKGQKVAILAAWGDALSGERLPKLAGDRYAQALAAMGSPAKGDAALAAELHVRLAATHETQNDMEGAAAELQAAIPLLERAGDPRRAAQLADVLRKVRSAL